MEPLLGLPVVLPQSGSRLLLISLHNQLRTAILDGRLKPGVRLPSTRALAEGLRIGRNTAVAAYELLLGEGYLVVRRGSGTAVAELLPSRSNPAAEAARRGLQRRLNRYWRDRTLPQRRQAGAPPRYNFQVGAPDAANFPYDIWRRLRGRIERRLRSGLPLAADAQGLPALREAIAQHASFARAVACGPQDIVVTAGAHQAFDLLARILTTAGRTTVAIENPGYPPVREAFAAHGARIAPVPVDAEGLVVGNIPAAARVVCVHAVPPFPLGAVMSARRRTALLDACSRRRAVIIEDDYDGEFRFADRPLDALQTLDRMGSVFYVGTFSKKPSPGLETRLRRGATLGARRIGRGKTRCRWTEQRDDPGDGRPADTRRSPSPGTSARCSASTADGATGSWKDCEPASIAGSRCCPPSLGCTSPLGSRLCGRMR